MHPAFSVIFLTTLIGAGQGLFLALFFSQVSVVTNLIPQQDSHFYAVGSLISVLFLVVGLFASFFHLGHPERAWRSAAMWRTSWLSREVIVLPMFTLTVIIYGALHYFGFHKNLVGANPVSDVTFIVGAIGAVLCFALFICTGMIYACLKFLQEWHTVLTPINFTLLGMASGYMLVTPLANFSVPGNLNYYADTAIILTFIAFIFRVASLVRNRRLKPKSTLQSAIGVRHSNIQQKAQGAMGGSFNTREFFHGKSAVFVKNVKWIFLVLTFPLPALLVVIGLVSDLSYFFYMAFILQYIGLLAERWFFFAQANHPQNLYYQTI
ncbi:MAG: dimethyl sulfoxide reductase anchor subunit [Gammaproteobacteria bacterium]|nr:dimethyl sulfoxide reductase anchor subunit [Gammaproteobacteria bacterium]